MLQFETWKRQLPFFEFGTLGTFELMGQISANKERQMPDDRHLQEESRKRGFVVRNNVKSLNLRPERQVVQCLHSAGYGLTRLWVNTSAHTWLEKVLYACLTSFHLLNSKSYFPVLTCSQL